MKRLFFSALLGLTLLPSLASAAATDYYINNGVVLATYPEPGPRIDATTFINRGSFTIYGSQYPYDTWNTLNFTNTGYMYGSPGFRFDLSASSMVGNNFFPQASANFVNASYAGQTAYVYGDPWLTVHATNVINSGTLGTSFSGLLKLTGDSVDLTRGSLMAGDGRFYGSMYEDYWGIGTNRLDAIFDSFAGEDLAVSSPMDIMGYLRGFGYYTQPDHVVVALPAVTYMNKVTPGPETDAAVDVLIIGNDNEDVVADVRFESLGGPTTKVVRWEGYVTNRTTGVITTNQLFLEDRFTRYQVPGFVTNASGVVNSGEYTVRPENYRVTLNYNRFNNLQKVESVPLDPTVFVGDEAAPNVLNTTYGVTIEAALSAPDPNLAGSTYTNLAGRVEIAAKKVLNLTRSQISGATFVSIEGTNHFVGSAQSSIVAPFSSFKLTSTNSTLAITNLLSPDVPCLNGTIEVWSGRWTNANADGSVMYNVTIVHSSLRPAAVPFIDQLHLKAPNVVISDEMNVVGNSLINAESLTITANGSNAPAAVGELNLLENRLVWTEVFPRLHSVTNNGVLMTTNSAFFGGARTAPWFTYRFDEPYQAFVNTGIIRSQGNDTWARSYQFAGINDSGVGPLTVRADTAIIKDGSYVAGEDVSINARSLYVSNQVITAIRGINLAASGFLDDGSRDLDYSITPEPWNFFDAGNGIHLLEAPARASLRGTTVRLSSYPNGEIPIRWAGADRGDTKSGFTYSATVGRLVLDGQLNSVFTFSGVTGNNALYVNALELVNFAAVFNSDETALAGIDIKPGMKIYFRKAIVNGEEGEAVSKMIGGKNGGALVWVNDPPGSLPVGDAEPKDDLSPTQDPETPANPQPTVEYPTVPNPYVGSPTIVGSYQGLIYAPEGVTVAGSGAFKLSVNNRGVYTGRIKLGGKEYPISGKLDAEDHATISLASGTLTVAFDVDDSGEGKVEGTVTGAFGTSQIAADRIPNGAKTKSAYAGRYTVTIPAGEGYGSAYGTVLVTPASTLVLNLTLGDGTKLNQTLAASPDGVWPLYASLYKGVGMVLSWVKFDGNTLGGKVLWINGDVFSRDTQVIGSRFNAKTANKRSITLFDGASGGYGQLVFSGSSLTDTQAVKVIIGKNNKVKFPDGEKVTLQLLGSTGLFQGTFRIPGVSKPVSFKGALLQEQNYGAGLFISNGVAGEVRLCAPGE